MIDIVFLLFLPRYINKVSVEPRVYKNLKIFMENKEDNDELFDRLTVRKDCLTSD